MTRFPYPLVQKIRAALEIAEDAMWDKAFELGYPDAKNKIRDGHYVDPVAVLESKLGTALGDLRMLAETMGQLDCVERIKVYQAKQGKRFGSVLFYHETDDTYSPGLDEAKGFLESLIAAQDDRATRDPQPFETILRNTAKIVHDAGVQPQNETDVKDAVFKVLRYAYPDAWRKQPIPHPIKSYVPDFASKAAQSVAEYKVVHDRQNLAVACDHLAKSMFGYSGDATWAEKFGVIYLTSPFATQADVDAHFKSIGKPEEWKIILLNGKGGLNGGKRKPARIGNARAAVSAEHKRKKPAKPFRRRPLSSSS